MTSTTHLAGITIRIGDKNPRVIQRCSICGLKLCDNARTAVPLNADGTTPEFPTWPTGRLVRQSGGNPESWILLDDPEDGKLPKDSCIDLVEE